MQKERFSDRRKADKIIRKVEKVLNAPLDSGKDLTYFTTTQNLSYFNMFAKEGMKSACVVVGAGDTVFQLLSMGITDITAVDKNELQTLVFALKKAAIKALSLSEYEYFILDSSSIHFLDYDVYDFGVRYGFDESEKVEQIFWREILKNHSKHDLLLHFSKFGLESVSLDAVHKSMAYTKRKAQYNAVRKNLEKATLTIRTGDMINFLEKTNKVFDFIDITNILASVFQDLGCDEMLYNERLKIMKKVYEKNLSKDGTFVLDYIFNTKKEDFLHLLL